MNTAKCRSCGAEIVWAKTAAGKNMPVDAAHNPSGNIRLLADGTCGVMTEMELMSWEGTKHTSHFATCPNAAAHRKEKA